MTEDDPRKRLDLGIGDRRALDLREVLDLRLREFDVDDVLGIETVDAGIDLALRQAIGLAIEAVELDTEFAHRRVAARFDIGKHRLDRLADFRVGRRLLVGHRAALQPFRHVISSQFARQRTHRCRFD